MDVASFLSQTLVVFRIFARDFLWELGLGAMNLSVFGSLTSLVFPRPLWQIPHPPHLHPWLLLLLLHLPLLSGIVALVISPVRGFPLLWAVVF
jgi:hypothetical protein